MAEETIALNVAESWPLYDTIVVCSELFGKEKSIVGWFTNFRDFAANERHTFFKSRTIGNSHLAYCNLDSADNVDFVYNVFSIGIRFFAPISPDGIHTGLESPSFMNEAMVPWWLFELPKHIGMDFRVQQDVIVENSCLAMPPGYGPRIGGGSVATTPASSSITDLENLQPFKIVTGTNGEPCIDNRFDFKEPIRVPRNTSIEVNLYPTKYARDVMENLTGPHDWVLLTESQSAQIPVDADWYTVPARYGIQVSLNGYREVQQRGQYHAPGAIQRG